MANVGTAYVTIVPEVRQFGRQLSGQVTGEAAKVGQATGRQFGGAMSTGAGSILKTGLLTGVGAAFAGIGAAATWGVSVAAQNEQAQISFETMLGSATKARSFLGDLQKFAAATPFEFPELQTAASSLISAGINANKVIPIMTTLGNVTSGMGTGSEGIQRATVALQQMNAAGKITGDDLNQLRNAGIPVYDLLSAATGRSKAQIVALAQAGKLGGKDLAALMKGLETGKGLERFNGLMAKQSLSLTGIISTLKDTLGQGLANAVTPALPVIKSAIGAASGFLGVIMKGIGSFAKVITPIMQRFGPQIAGAVAAIAGLAVGAGIFTALSSAIALVATPIGGIVLAVGLLGAGFVTLWKRSQTFRNFVTTIGAYIRSTVLPALASFGGFITGTVIPALQRFAQTQVVPFLQRIGAFISGTVVPALQRFGALVAAYVVPVLQRFGAFIMTTVVPAVVRLGQFVAVNLMPAFVAIGNFITTRVVPALGLLGQFVMTTVVPALQGLWARFVQVLPTIMAFAGFLAKVIGVVIAVAAVIIGRLVPVILTVAGFILSTLIPVIVNVAGPIFTLLFAAIGKIIGIVAGLIRVFIAIVTTIVRVTVAIVTFVAGAISAFFRFAGGVGSAIATAVRWVAGLPGRAVTALAALGGMLLNAARTGFDRLKQGASDAVKGLFDLVRGIPGRIKDGLGDVAGMLVRSGEQIVEGLIRGIGNMASKAGDAAKHLASDVVHGVGNIIRPGSPSRTFIEIGHTIPQGFALGINRGSGQAVTAAGNMAASAVRAGSASFPRTVIPPVAGVAGGGGGASVVVNADVRETADITMLINRLEYATRAGSFG
jgi:tape measure domain-containing protein